MRLLPLLLLLASAGPASARATLRFGITASAAPWSEPATAQAAARPLLDTIARGAQLSVSLEAGLSASQLLAKLRSGELNAAFAGSEEFLAIAAQLPVEPVLRGVVLGSSSHQLLLLVDASAGITRPAQLAGKAVSLYGQESLQRTYLETLLAREKIGEVEIREKKDAQSPALDVLFREAAACVVSDRTFAAMAELNPQLRKRLAAIARSAPLANPPIFLRRDLGKAVLQRVIEHGAKIHEGERGRQLMLMFRVGRLVATRSVDYQSLRELLAEHARLVARRKGASP